MSTAVHEREFLTVGELAERLRVSPLTIYRGVRNGTVPFVRLSEHGAIRIPVTALEEFAHRSESLACAPRTALAAVEPPAHGGEAA